MNIKDFETLGYYEPVFLHLRVNNNEDIFDLNELLKNKDKIRLFSTFLHEYIHFLQNVTTTYGLMYSIFYIDLIKEINWTIRHDGKPEFEVPVTITNHSNIEVNIKLQGIYRGDDKGSELIKYDCYEVEETEVMDRDGNISRPVKYRVKYHDLITRRYKSMYFGATCIKEYMAHVIQSKFSPDTKHPDIPYLIAELIIEKEYPDLCKDKMLIVALCDASLMCLHPAQMFFKTIERMRNETFIAKSVADIYDFTFADLTFEGQFGKLTPKELFDKFIELTNSQFYDALQADIFEPNYLWIKHIFTEAQKLRENHISFITELVEDKEKLSSTFFQVVQNFGTPFFTNNTGKGGFIPPKDLNKLPIQPYQLLVFKQVINIFYGKNSCSLYDFCKSRPDKDITNNLCQTAPWKRVNELELCSLAQIWKTWGLINEIPVPKVS